MNEMFALIEHFRLEILREILELGKQNLTPISYAYLIHFRSNPMDFHGVRSSSFSWSRAQRQELLQRRTPYPSSQGALLRSSL